MSLPAHRIPLTQNVRDQPGATALAGTTASSGKGDSGEEHEQSTVEMMRLSEALEEVDALRVHVQSRDAALQAQV